MSGSNNPFYKASENTYQDPLSKASMGSVQVSKEKVDLSDPKLEEAKKAVRDLNSSTNWVAFTYTGTSNVLKVADSGEGGWSQAIDSLNSGKQMFLFLKIKLEETSVPKFVYLTWNPAAVPPMLKGLIHGRSYDIGKWIGQFHLQIDAQSETDLDEDKMIEKLKRSANK